MLYNNKALQQALQGFCQKAPITSRRRRRPGGDGSMPCCPAPESAGLAPDDMKGSVVMLLSGAGIIVEELIRHGVDIVFGYPGGYVINIYDELYKNSRRITHILSAHEQGAAHAADAYARVSGRTSAVIATSGPGATNLVTGIANAYLDSVPVVFITGNVPIPMLGGDSFQEIDTIGVTMPVVKHSYVVKNIKNLQRTLNEAFMIAGTDRKGPVLVDVPKNVQLGEYEYDPDFAAQNPAGIRTPGGVGGIVNPGSPGGFGSIVSPGGRGGSGSLADALDAINKSQKPFIYCGGGVTAANAGEEVVELSKKTGAPVGMSMMGLGAVPYSYELSLGMCGMHGRYASTVAESEADLIIALGVRFSDRATGNTKEYAKNATVVHVDIDAAEIGKNVRADISLCGDLRDILPLLTDGARALPRRSWLDRIRELKAEGGAPVTAEFTPRNIIHHVNEFYGADAPVATDVGQHQMWAAQYYRFEKPRGFITSGGLGAMGFGLGAAIGASLARGGKRTVLFTGDGSFGMNLTEMATAVTYKLPITIILLNNGALGMLRQWQTLFLDRRYSQTTLGRKTDFPALAKAFGASGFTAETLSGLDEALKNLPEDGPALIDCKIDIDEKVFPMIPDGGTIRDMLY